ncbi:hypothetical protein GQ53DRAFT_837633 [Thozetella sp. PMI_491]|nr:hypothetical protein GQ53DRAFT_837633 [Thozetella sp. PMI_491]
MSPGIALIRAAKEAILKKSAASFTYSPLPDSERFIRLVELEDTGDTDAIRCRLKHVDIATNPDFDALSYAWQKAVPRRPKKKGGRAITSPSYDAAQAGPTRTIVCDGAVLSIALNLYEFLLRLRHWRRRRPIWIDAFCINQSDVTERTRQVSLMDRIYGQAHTVIVWLGEASVFVSSALKFAQNLPTLAAYKPAPFRERHYIFEESNSEDLLQKLGLENDRVDNLAAVTSFMVGMTFFQEIDYFNRSWVVQELVLAKRLQIYTGDLEVPLDILERCITVLDAMMIRAEYHSVKGLDLYPGLQTMPYVLQARDRHLTAAQWPLEDYIWLIRDRMVTEPRDKVFSLLSIAEKSSLSLDDAALGSAAASNSLKNASRVLRADYAKSTVDVFLECTKCLLRSNNLPYVLSIVGKTQEGIENLPSWIPDYSVPLRPRPFWSLGPRRFAAWTHSDCPFTIIEDKKILNLQTAVLDIITVCGESSKGISFTSQVELRGLCGQFVALVTQLGKTYKPTEEATLTAFFRTLTADIFSSTTAALADLQQEFFGFIVGILAAAAVCQSKTMMPVTERWMTSLVCAIEQYPYGKGKNPWLGDERFVNSTPSAQKVLEEFLALNPESVSRLEQSNKHPDTFMRGRVAKAFADMYAGRRVFRTAEGYLGIGNSRLQDGDAVMLVAGASTPFIFRSVDGQNTFSLVGEAYVHGVMDGEALNFGPDEPQLEWRTISVV